MIKLPEWAREAVIYQIFPDRFSMEIIQMIPLEWSSRVINLQGIISLGRSRRCYSKTRLHPIIGDKYNLLNPPSFLLRLTINMTQAIITRWMKYLVVIQPS